MDAGQVVVKIGADAAGLTSGFNQAASSVQRSMARIEGAYRDANGRLRDANGRFLRESQLAWNGVAQSVDSAGNATLSFSGRMGQLGGKLKGFAIGAATTGVVAFGAALAGTAVAGIRFNSSVEQTTIAMGTMLGSTAKAKDLIADVQKMAAATPFEFPELADATKRLVAYGIAAGDAVPLMRRLGDISSALQIPIGELSDIYGRMKVSGRITMEDMNQLAGRGIPIYSSLAQVMGVNESQIRGMVESGKVGFPQIEKAFQQMTDKGSMFGGMMDKQSRSFSGLWSTLVDSFNMMAGTAIKPLFGWLTSTAMPSLISAMPAIQSVVVTIAGAIGSAISFIIPYVTRVIGFVRSVAAVLGPIIGESLARIAPVMGQVLSAVGEVLSAIGNRVGQLVAFIRSHWDTIGPIVKAAWDFVQTYSETAMKVIAQVLKAVADLINGDWSAAWQHLTDAVEKAFGGAQEMTRIGTVVLQGLMKILGELMVAELKALPGQLKTLAKVSLDMFGDAVKAGAKITITWVAGLPAKIIAGLSGLSGLMTAAGKAALKALGEGAKTAWGAVKDWFSGLPGKVKTIFAGAGSWLLAAGRAIMSGLLSGITAAWNSVASFLSGLGQKIKDLKGPLDKDRGLLVPEGAAIMAGLVAGIISGEDELRRTLRRVGADMSIGGGSSAYSSGGGISGYGGSTHINVSFSGPIYATTPAQARQSVGVAANEVIQRLALARRATARGTA